MEGGGSSGCFVTIDPGGNKTGRPPFDLVFDFIGFRLMFI
jgi:hypothetical protein